MPHNHFKGNEHPLHIPWDGPWFLDDLHLTNKATIGSVDLNEVCFADTCFLNEFEPVGCCSVQRFPFSWNQRRNDLVED